MFACLKKPKLALALAASFLAIPSASAAIVPLTNGNFESGIGNQDVPGWFDFSSGNGDLVQSDSVTGITSLPDDPNGGGWLNLVDNQTFSPGGPRGVYQSFGTHDAGVLSYEVAFEIGDRGNANVFNNFNVQLFTGIGGSAANGTLPGAAGLSQIDAELVTFSNEISTPSTESVVVSFDATGIAVGETLWIAFASTVDENAPGVEQALIDDIAITAVIPEPASLALLAAGGILIAGRRRHG